jgi:hypothetical protein
VHEIAEILVKDEVDIEAPAQALEDIGDRGVLQAQADLFVLADVQLHGRNQRGLHFFIRDGLGGIDKGIELL